MHDSDKIFSPVDGVQLSRWDRSLDCLNRLQQGRSNPAVVSQGDSFG